MKYFIVEMTYLAPIEIIREGYVAHRAWLQKGYDQNLFLCSGPKSDPPVGGYLVARARSKAELEALFAEEPFNKAGVGALTFTEFQPVKAGELGRALVQRAGLRREAVASPTRAAPSGHQRLRSRSCLKVKACHPETCRSGARAPDVTGGCEMAADLEEVAAAFKTYIAALGSLDIAVIAPLWAHDDAVTQVEPNSEAITVGWPAVKRNLESFFGSFSVLDIHIADGPHVQVVGDVGWTTSITPATGKTKSGENVTLRVCTTQVFERRGASWLVRSNIALPVPR